MSQIKIKCPLCNYIQEIPEIYVYKSIKCRKCYKSIEAKPYNEPVVIDKNKEQFICSYCEYIGHSKNKTLGFMEILLWLVFFPAGIIYTIWRLSTQCNICPGCQKRNTMIRIDTPLGQKLINQSKTVSFKK